MERYKSVGHRRECICMDAVVWVRNAITYLRDAAMSLMLASVVVRGTTVLMNSGLGISSDVISLVTDAHVFGLDVASSMNDALVLGMLVLYSVRGDRLVMRVVLLMCSVSEGCVDAAWSFAQGCVCLVRCCVSGFRLGISSLGGIVFFRGTHKRSIV
jgi:hypothetical protein